MKPIIRYSEAFKLQVLRELDEGRFATPWAAARTYGIRGVGTIERWARKYNQYHLLRKVVRVETPKEVNEINALRKRVRELEKALSDAHLKERFDEAYLKIACQWAGVDDINDFKKKHAGKL